MASYASNQSTQIGDETILNDIKANDDNNINVKSVHTYIST